MFVISQQSLDLGTGRLIQNNGRVATIEYFDHPGPGGRHTLDFPASGVRQRKLEPQTRVFFVSDEGHWRVGRVVECQGQAIEVQFRPQSSVLIPTSELYVRWNRPVIDPASFLTVFLSEARQLSTLRRAFLREATLQRSLGAGLEGLLSSCVELLPHQMNVVRRVLTDPVQRYLLADEVGLGKTVEAAAIIRQHVIDDPQSHRVVIVVPEPLVEQWRDELCRRFHLGPPFLDDSILVIHAGDDDLKEALAGARLVVVDEAHNIVGRSTADNAARTRLATIRDACRKAEVLLLLSATPAIADEDSFFELMQLIDPEVYTAVDRDAFHQRITHRQELAQIIAGFEPGALQFLVDDGRRLMEMFPEDARLAELVETLNPVASEAADPEQPRLVEAVQAVRRHLSETYRLHRRILRNRRKNAAGLTPPRAGALRIEFEDVTAGHVARQLENWRTECVLDTRAASKLDSLYAEWTRLLLEVPCSLREAVQARLDDSYRRGSDKKEQQVLERLLRHLADWDPMESRIRALTEAVRTHGSPRCKLVIFCSDSHVADRCFGALRSHHGFAVARHDTRPNDDPERPPDWNRFIRSPECWMLVCDARAEEGLNLQGGRKTVVHVDLPLAPNRIEQRLGRVDRFGSGDPIRSIVLTCADSESERAWSDCVIEGFGVMDRSIASLQYLVDQQIRSLRRDLASEGVSAINLLTARLGGEQGGIRAELRRIDQQDELEALQSEDAETYEALTDVDDDWSRVRDAVEPWLQRGLQFVRQVQQEDQRGVEDVVRYRYGGLGDRGTQISVGRFRADFLGAIDTDMRHANVVHPTTYRYAYRRQTSVNRFTHLMRAGDPLFAGLLALALTEDRGRIDAVWRCRPDYEGHSGGPDLFLRLDFLVEANLDPAMEMFPDDGSAQNRRRALGRRMDLALAPEYVTLWLDRSQDEVDPAFVAQWLEPVAGEADVPGSDTDLTPAAWQRVRASAISDALLAWGDLIEQAVATARTCIAGNVSLRQRAEDANRQFRASEAARLARIESRLIMLSGRERALEEGRLLFERGLGRALQQGVSEPLMRLDAIGALFLGDRPLPASA